MMTNLVRNNVLLSIIIAGLLLFFSGCDKGGHRFVLKTAFKNTNSVTITFAGEIDEDWAAQGKLYTFYEKADQVWFLA